MQDTARTRLHVLKDQEVWKKNGAGFHQKICRAGDPKYQRRELGQLFVLEGLGNRRRPGWECGERHSCHGVGCWIEFAFAAKFLF